MDYQDIIVATTAAIDGFHIIEQCGLVFGDAVYTQDFVARHNSRTNDSWNLLLRSSENSNKTATLISQARKIAYDAMIADAENKKANAIVSVIANTNIGNDLIHVSIYGTAVRIITQDEYDNWKARKEKAALENKINYFNTLSVQKKRQSEGNNSAEKNFLMAIENVDSFKIILDIWRESRLSVYYPDLEDLIEKKYSMEKSYGKMPGSIKETKIQLRQKLLGKD